MATHLGLLAGPEPAPGPVLGPGPGQHTTAGSRQPRRPGGWGPSEPGPERWPLLLRRP